MNKAKWNVSGFFRDKYFGVVFLYIIAFLCIFLCFYKTLFISISGDDIFHVFLYVFRDDWVNGGLKEIDESHLKLSQGLWFSSWADKYLPHSLAGFFSLNGARTFILGTIYKYFGLYSAPYYLLSMLFRSLAAMVIFLLTKKLFDNKIAGIMSCLLFSVGYIGIEAFEQVHNMPAFIALIFVGLFFLFYCPISWEEGKEKTCLSHFSSSKYYLSVLFFILASVFDPKKLMLFILIFILIEFLGFSKRNFIYKIRGAVFRLVPFFMVYVFSVTLFTIGISSSHYKTQITAALHQFVNVFLHQFTTFGNITIPYPAYVYLSACVLPYSAVSNSPFEKMLTLLYISLLFLLISGFSKPFSKNRISSFIISIGVTMVCGLFLYYQWGGNRSIETCRVGFTMIGLLFSISTIAIAIRIRQEQRYHSNMIIVMLVFVFLSYISPYVNQTSFNIWYLSYTRHLIPSFFAFTILLGCFVSLCRFDTFSFQLKRIPTVIIITTIVASYFTMNILSCNRYLEGFLNSRNNDDTINIWNTIKKGVPDIKNENIQFYFTYAPEDYNAFHGMISFGWPLRIGLAFNEPDIIKFWEVPQRLIVNNFDDLVKIAKEKGEKNIYSFRLHLTNNYSLKNTTTETREKLRNLTK